MMNWWLDRGIDGFCMDVINLIPEDPNLPNGVIYSGRAWGGGLPCSSGDPHLREYLAEMRREVFDDRAGTMTVGGYPGVRRDDALLFTDFARCEFDIMFQSDHISLGFKMGKFHPRPPYPGELTGYPT